MSEQERPLDAITAALAQPFAPDEVKWKAQSVKGDRAMAVAYADARVVQDRLDDVLGPANWQDAYEVLPDGAVVCTLRLRLGGEWISKTDVGGESEQPDEGDRRKAAFSDSLKRAAVKFGVGRYLYRLPQQWVGYDAQRNRLTERPKLPAWATPDRPAAAKQPAPASAPAAAPAAPVAPPAAKAAPEAPPAPPAGQGALKKRLVAYEDRLVNEGVCRAGELLAFLAEAGHRAGWGTNLADWAGEDVTKWAAGQVRAFEARARAARPLTEGELNALGEALNAQGLTWADLLPALGLAEGSDPSAITAGHLAAAQKWVGENSGIPI
jgi:hypothetical protein